MERKMDNIGPNIWQDGIQVRNIRCFVTENAKEHFCSYLLIYCVFLVPGFGGMKLPLREPFYLMLQAPLLCLL